MMLDDRLRLVVGENLDIGVLLLLADSGRKYRVAEFNRDTTEAVLEPVMEMEIKPFYHEAGRYELPPAPSKFLPGNPQPWKRRGKRK